MSNIKIAIIGSGIQGVCNALFLQKKGFHVTLFDRNEPGNAASYGNVGGTCNTAVGAFSLYCNAEGDYNVAVGRTALRNNTCGLNVGIGYAAGYNGTTAEGIVAVGGQSLFTNVPGANQTALGYRALYKSYAPGNTAGGSFAHQARAASMAAASSGT